MTQRRKQWQEVKEGGRKISEKQKNKRAKRRRK